MFSQRIDTHVHCRDWKQSYKEATIRSVTDLARTNGIKAIIDMPNTNPLIISEELVEERLKTADKEGCLDGYYLNMGITKDIEQIKKAADVATKNPRVVGLKYFTTGKDEISIPNENDQLRIYETLAKCEYQGVVVPHCEKESFFNPGSFNPNEPWTWNKERPPEAEEQAVYDQLKFASEADFRGHIHIPHVSSPFSVDIIKNFSRSLRVSGEVTPHHLLYSTEDLVGEFGLDVKINPPIRKKEYVDLLWKKLREGVIKLTIGTDNAPHTLEEKRNPPYMSGYRSLLIYGNLLERFKQEGITEKEMENLTYWNAKKIFQKIIE